MNVMFVVFGGMTAQTKKIGYGVNSVNIGHIRTVVNFIVETLFVIYAHNDIYIYICFIFLPLGNFSSVINLIDCHSFSYYVDRAEILMKKLQFLCVAGQFNLYRTQSSNI